MPAFSGMFKHTVRCRCQSNPQFLFPNTTGDTSRKRWQNIPDLLERSLSPDIAGAWKADAAAMRARTATTRRTAMETTKVTQIRRFCFVNSSGSHTTISITLFIIRYVSEPGKRKRLALHGYSDLWFSF